MTSNEEGKLKIVVNKILKQANLLEDNEFGSVIGILMIISIVLTLIRVFQECNKTKLKNLSGNDKYALYSEQIKTFSKKTSVKTKEIMCIRILKK